MRPPAGLGIVIPRAKDNIGRTFVAAQRFSLMPSRTCKRNFLTRVVQNYSKPLTRLFAFARGRAEAIAQPDTSASTLDWLTPGTCPEAFGWLAWSRIRQGDPSLVAFGFGG
jgi:hypothetical protein